MENLEADSRETLVGVDVGGTFTDVILYNNKTKESKAIKIPTTSSNIEDAILNALSSSDTDPRKIKIINHATTIATNALLTASGLAKTALVTNDGFRDVLEIGRQRRPELYNLYTKRPVPLVKREDRFTIRGRMLFDGTEHEPLSEDEVRTLATKLALRNYDCVVIGLLNSYSNNAHERNVAKILKRGGFKGRIVISSEVNNEYREYERISTAVVNAVLMPLIAEYLRKLSEDLRRRGYLSPIYVMNSDGNVSSLALASKFPISIIESGPAAGVLACADLARNISLHKVATFDMGGTTAKAGMITNFEPDISYEFEASGSTHSGRSIKGSGYPVRHPFIDLAEVSAGGGTIAWVDDGGALKLGPQSTGADPGPAAYGKGGKLPTITDANMVLGRLDPNFLLGGKMRVYYSLAWTAINDQIAKKLDMSVEEAARSIIRVANHSMAKAISIVSVERGRDPREYTLVGFGGAGPLHICDLAEEMSITEVVVPDHPGLFSAYGLLTVDLARMFSKPVMGTSPEDLDDTFKKLCRQSEIVLEQEGYSNFKLVRYVDLRYLGQSFELTLPYQDDYDIRMMFDAKHAELYGYSSRESKVEFVNAKIKAIVTVPKVQRKEEQPRQTLGTQNDFANQNRHVWVSGRDAETPVLSRELLVTGNKGNGPCVIEEYDSTTIVNFGWTWRVDGFRNLRLARDSC